MATFETEVPPWDAWHEAHPLRVVAELDERVIGWAALGPRVVALGVPRRRASRASTSRATQQRHGHRPALMEALIEKSERAGIWTLQTSIFPENEASLKLHHRVGFRVVGVRKRIGKRDGLWRDTVLMERRSEVIAVIKVEAVVIRERIETVIDAVEEATGHVGVTVIEAVGHGRQRGITHEYRGRVFESRFLPKALLIFVVEDDRVDGVVAAIADAARSGNESGDGLVWTTPVGNVMHNRTGMPLEEVEVG